MNHDNQPWERRLKVLEAQSKQKEAEQNTRATTATLSAAFKALQQQTSPVIPGQSDSVDAPFVPMKVNAQWRVVRYYTGKSDDSLSFPDMYRLLFKVEP